MKPIAKVIHCSQYSGTIEFFEKMPPEGTLLYAGPRPVATQSRKESFIEACINVGIGFVISFTVQLISFPMFGIHVSMGTHLGVITVFTVTSVLRSYIVRRWFNAKLHRLAQRLSKEIT